MSNLYPYPSDAKAVDAIKWGTKVFCNVLVRFFYIDFHNLVKGSDTLAIRFLRDGDSSWDSVSALMSFLGDFRVPAIRNAGGRDKSVIVNPTSWLADKYWTVFKDIGAGFH